MNSLIRHPLAISAAVKEPCFSTLWLPLSEPGAYSDLACRTACPDMATLPCDTFEDTFAAVGEGRAAKAMIAIDNSVAGRVADVCVLTGVSADLGTLLADDNIQLA
jgi:hypothetical protein